MFRRSVEAEIEKLAKACVLVMRDQDSRYGYGYFNNIETPKPYRELLVEMWDIIGERKLYLVDKLHALRKDRLSQDDIHQIIRQYSGKIEQYLAVANSTGPIYHALWPNVPGDLEDDKIRQYLFSVAGRWEKLRTVDDRRKEVLTTAINRAEIRADMQNFNFLNVPVSTVPDSGKVYFYIGGLISAQWEAERAAEIKAIRKELRKLQKFNWVKPVVLTAIMEQ